jgi:single-stranded-DNA-specific exonuclease
MELSGADAENSITVDAELPLSYLNPDIFTLIDRFEPYGEGNEALTFMARKLRVAELSLMGKPDLKHVKLNLDAGKHKWPAVYWNASEKVKKDFDTEDHVDMVFKITRNFFNGNETPQLVVSDLQRSGGA